MVLNKELVYFAGVRGNAIVLSHKFLADILTDGSMAVDATAGNGYDTLFLAQAVGVNGKVYSFDIQRQALNNTTQLLKQHQQEQKVQLINACHSNLAQYIQAPVDGFIFNLGYLPGGDHDIITKPATTVAALNAALKLIKPGGRISIVVYPGHLGGSQEGEALVDYATQLDPAYFGVLQVTLPNRPNNTPFLLLIERVKK